MELGLPSVRIGSKEYFPLLLNLLEVISLRISSSHGERNHACEWLFVWRIDLRREDFEKARISIADCPSLKSFVFVIHWTSIILKIVGGNRRRIETRIRRNYLNEVSLMSISNVSLFSERDFFEDLTSLETSGSNVPLRSQLRVKKRTKIFYDKVLVESWSEVQHGP